MKKLILFIFCCLFTTSAFAQQKEEILFYKALIQVQPDASVIVKEQIAVRALGINIRRGIYRDLPITDGVDYRVLNIKKNGQKEPFFITYPQKTLRINLGNDDFLQKGSVYIYSITYKATNVILAFDKYDELYWNVTGNGWSFPIRHVSAKVQLPQNASTKQASVYIGKKGSTEQGVINKDVYSTTRPLKTGEGMTIAVGFDKGFVQVPASHTDNSLRMLERKISQIPTQTLETLLWIVFFNYLFFTWFLYGRDPEKKAIMPRFDTPLNLTPAQAARIFLHAEDKETCFSLALLQGGISGFYKIEDNGDFTFEKQREPKNEEEKLLNRIHLGKSFSLGDFYSQKIERALNAFTAHQKKTDLTYFAKNTKFFIIGLLLFLGLLNGFGYLTQTTQMTVLLSAYSAFFILILIAIFNALIMKKGLKFALIFPLVFICIHFATMLQSFQIPLSLLAFYAAGVISLVLYRYLIIRPTQDGQDVIEHLEGIRMFLEAIDPTQSKIIDTTQMEKLLPYAILFGLEEQWEEKIKIISAKEYRPKWYSGSFFSHARMKNMQHSCHAAAQRPSRSGSGGGGFSGGGFGGGGGGGR